MDTSRPYALSAELSRLEFGRILILKPSSLGDVIHTLPVLSALRARFPNAYIAWFVKKQWADLLHRIEGLDQVWAVGHGLRNWLAEIPRLRQKDFDLAVDFQGLFRSGAMAWLSGAPVRIGFANGREASSLFYTHKVVVDNPDMHAVDRYVLVAQALGATVDQPAFTIHISDSDLGKAGELLTKHGLNIDSPWIAMNIGGRWPTKRWPSKFFAMTADQLQQKGLGRIVLIGGPEDQGVAQEVTSLMVTTPIDLTGKTPLTILPALLQATRVLITNDSGPMHLAAALRTPVVAVFGPTNPARTGPYGKEHVTLVSEVPCHPCYSRSCQNAKQLECLFTIAPRQVVEAAESLCSSRLLKKTAATFSCDG